MPRELAQLDRNRIEVFSAGGQQLVQAFAGLSREDLLAVPIPGTWSLQQIAIHMLESDLIGCDRMKRIACMDKPLLIGYDESAFACLPGVDRLDVAEACQMFDKNRQMMATMLRAFPDAAFERWGIHNEIGKVTLAEMVDKYVHHLEGHLVHVYKKRGLLGRHETKQ